MKGDLRRVNEIESKMEVEKRKRKEEGKPRWDLMDGGHEKSLKIQ